jgi:hypothetical protein
MNTPRHIFIQGPVSFHTNIALLNLCKQSRNQFGLDYGDTFAEVVRLGIEAYEAKQTAVLHHTSHTFQRVRA